MMTTSDTITTTSTAAASRPVCEYPGCGQPAAPAERPGRPPGYCAGRGHTRVSAWRERHRIAAEKNGTTISPADDANLDRGTARQVAADAGAATRQAQQETARAQAAAEAAQAETERVRAEAQAGAYRAELGQLRAASPDAGPAEPHTAWARSRPGDPVLPERGRGQAIAPTQPGKTLVPP